MSSTNTRTVDGVPCINRAGIAERAGWSPGNSVHVRAGTDPAFPRPLRRDQQGYWYPVTDVTAYLEILARRAEKKKPPPVITGDPDELLDTQRAAEALGIDPSTMRSYVRYSQARWAGREPGRPLLPPPDEVIEMYGRKRRRWYRRTLAEHQAGRLGPGTGAGRPAGQRGQRQS